MKKVYEAIEQRSIYQVSTKQLEAGERPGWINHSIYYMEGDRIRLVFDIQKKLPAWKAYLGIIRIYLRSNVGFYVAHTQEIAHTPEVLREKYEDLSVGEQVRDSEEDA